MHTSHFHSNTTHPSFANSMNTTTTTTNTTTATATTTGTCYFLGLELSIDQLRAAVVDDNLDLVGVESVDFDTELPEYQTHGGVMTTPGEAYTTPVEMWVKALDLLMDKLRLSFDLSRVKCISGSAQHACVYWRTGALSTLSRLSPDRSLYDQLCGYGANNIFTLRCVPTQLDTSAYSHSVLLNQALSSVYSNNSSGSLNYSNKNINGFSFLTLTGQPLSSTSSAAQIMKVRESHPDIWARTGKITLASNFLASLLAGRWVCIGEAEAVESGMWCLGGRRWEVRVLAVVAGMDVSVGGTGGGATGNGSGEAARLELMLGDVDYAFGGRKVASLSTYFVERFGFARDTFITPFSSPTLLTHLSFLPSSSPIASPSAGVGRRSNSNSNSGSGSDSLNNNYDNDNDNDNSNNNETDPGHGPTNSHNHNYNKETFDISLHFGVTDDILTPLPGNIGYEALVDAFGGGAGVNGLGGEGVMVQTQTQTQGIGIGYGQFQQPAQQNMFPPFPPASSVPIPLPKSMSMYTSSSLTPQNAIPNANANAGGIANGNGNMKTSAAMGLFSILPHPCQDPAAEKRRYVLRVCNRNGDVPRALVRDMYTKSWSAFDRLIAIVPPGGSIGLDDKLFSFWLLQSESLSSSSMGSVYPSTITNPNPNSNNNLINSNNQTSSTSTNTTSSTYQPIHFQTLPLAKGIYRFEGGVKVGEFRDLRANPRTLVESQLLGLRVRLARVRDALFGIAVGEGSPKSAGSGGLSSTVVGAGASAGTMMTTSTAQRHLYTPPIDAHTPSHLPTRVFATGTAANFGSIVGIVGEIFNASVFVSVSQVVSARVGGVGGERVGSVATGTDAGEGGEEGDVVLQAQGEVDEGGVNVAKKKNSLVATMAVVESLNMNKAGVARAALGAAWVARWVWARDSSSSGLVGGSPSSGAGTAAGPGGKSMTFEEETRALLAKRWNVAVADNANATTNANMSATVSSSSVITNMNVPSTTTTPPTRSTSLSRKRLSLGMNNPPLVEEDEEEYEFEYNKNANQGIGNNNNFDSKSGFRGGGYIDSAMAAARGGGFEYDYGGNAVDPFILRNSPLSQGSVNVGGGVGVGTIGSGIVGGGMRTGSSSMNSFMSSSNSTNSIGVPGNQFGSAYTTPDLSLSTSFSMGSVGVGVGVDGNGQGNFLPMHNGPMVTPGGANAAGTPVGANAGAGPRPLTPIQPLPTSVSESQIGLVKVTEPDLDAFMAYAAIVPEFCRLEGMLGKMLV